MGRLILTATQRYDQTARYTGATHAGWSTSCWPRLAARRRLQVAANTTRPYQMLFGVWPRRTATRWSRSQKAASRRSTRIRSSSKGSVDVRKVARRLPAAWW